MWEVQQDSLLPIYCKGKNEGLYCSCCAVMEQRGQNPTSRGKTQTLACCDTKWLPGDTFQHNIQTWKASQITPPNPLSTTTRHRRQQPRQISLSFCWTSTFTILSNCTAWGRAAGSRVSMHCRWELSPLAVSRTAGGHPTDCSHAALAREPCCKSEPCSNSEPYCAPTLLQTQANALWSIF